MSDAPIHRKGPEKPLPKAWPVGEGAITLTLTANAGILVSFQEYKFLVDGIHAPGHHQFSPVPPELLERIVAGEAPFDGINWLFFTHLHIDHFSGADTQRFLERHPGVKLFLPAGNEGAGIAEDINDLRAYLTAHASPVQELKTPFGRQASYPLAPGIRVTAFFAEHDGEDYQDIEHDCLLFTLGGRNILFLGDAAQDPDYFADLLSGIPVDTAVTNPLFLNRPAGRETLIRAIHPEKLVVDHIPFAWEDRMRFREMVARNAARWRELLPPMAVLWDPLDTIQV